jgi:putative addiction module killer protein
MKMRYRIFKTPEYEEWVSCETERSKIQIDDRLSRIECDGHFGIWKTIGDGVLELKWNNGRRIYYSVIRESNVLLLLGGNKNGQDKDINKAKKILRGHATNEI